VPANISDFYLNIGAQLVLDQVDYISDAYYAPYSHNGTATSFDLTKIYGTTEAVLNVTKNYQLLLTDYTDNYKTMIPQITALFNSVNTTIVGLTPDYFRIPDKLNRTVLASILGEKIEYAALGGDIHLGPLNSSENYGIIYYRNDKLCFINANTSKEVNIYTNQLDGNQLYTSLTVKKTAYNVTFSEAKVISEWPITLNVSLLANHIQEGIVDSHYTLAGTYEIGVSYNYTVLLNIDSGLMYTENAMKNYTTRITTYPVAVTYQGYVNERSRTVIKTMCKGKLCWPLIGYTSTPYAKGIEGVFNSGNTSTIIRNSVL